MKKSLLAISLSLLIPFSLISCSKSTEAGQNEDNKVNNSTTTNNSTSSQKETNTNDEKDNETVDNKDTEKKEDVKIYYYDAVSDKIVYINTTININGNNASELLVDELKKSPGTDISPSISSEITLNSSNLDKDKSTITLDFSSNFVSAQNLGGGAESSTLTAITNTFGDYFDVENVIITLDGSPYLSGHILMNEGEAFKVDLEDAIELK
ncbi:GerMN domain-containing protein [Clostridium sp.]|uniref:GerMN domain-containing protein n=1 Tax=Clostridium sp. TaxID=1506 RepID=UPI002909C6FC|nr:GerMN domain-containing protein [Clostridium sp.]MDU5108419.1 GerMN domain-containing protein [Clostridium sp.]